MNHDELKSALAHFGIDVFDEETQQRVDEVLANGQTVEPAARRRLVGAAQRAMKGFTLESGPFEVLAFEQRRQVGVTVDSLAGAMGIDSSRIIDVERGEESLRSFEPSHIATWIDQLNLESETAIRSLEESLRQRSTLDAYAVREPTVALDDESRSFIEGVRSELLKLRIKHNGEIG